MADQLNQLNSNIFIRFTAPAPDRFSHNHQSKRNKIPDKFKYSDKGSCGEGLKYFPNRTYAKKPPRRRRKKKVVEIFKKKDTLFDDDLSNSNIVTSGDGESSNELTD